MAHYRYMPFFLMWVPSMLGVGLTAWLTSPTPAGAHVHDTYVVIGIVTRDMVGMAAMGVILVTLLSFVFQLVYSQHLYNAPQQVASWIALHKHLDLRAPLPVMEDYAIAPDFGRLLLFLAHEKRPQTIVELGSGTSTVILGTLLREFGSGKIISLDHEGEYLEQTRQALVRHGLEEIVELRHAPLEPIEVSGRRHRWYSQEACKDIDNIDLLIVDGPPARTQFLARYPALPIFHRHLAADAVVVVDDARRFSERRMTRRWMREFPGFRRENWPTFKGTIILRRSEYGQDARR